MADELTPELIQEFRQAFSLFDRQNNGSIDTTELRDLLMLLGMGQSEQEILAVIQEADEDGSGSIDEGEFLDLMAKLMRDQETEEEVSEAFRPIDEGCDGRVSVTAMYEGLGLTDKEREKLPIELFRDHVRSVIRIEQDGKIEYASFIRKMLMRK
jgi:calmodulin